MSPESLTMPSAQPAETGFLLTLKHNRSVLDTGTRTGTFFDTRGDKENLWTDTTVLQFLGVVQARCGGRRVPSCRDPTTFGQAITVRLSVHAVTSQVLAAKRCQQICRDAFRGKHPSLLCASVLSDRRVDGSWTCVVASCGFGDRETNTVDVYQVLSCTVGRCACH